MRNFTTASLRRHNFGRQWHEYINDCHGGRVNSASMAVFFVRNPIEFLLFFSYFKGTRNALFQRINRKNLSKIGDFYYTFVEKCATVID